MRSSMGRMTSHTLWKIKNVPNHHFAPLCALHCLRFVTGSSQAQQTPRSANERTPWRTPSATDPHPQDWAHQGKAKHLSNLQAMWLAGRQYWDDSEIPAWRRVALKTFPNHLARCIKPMCCKACSGCSAQICHPLAWIGPASPVWRA